MILESVVQDNRALVDLCNKCSPRKQYTVANKAFVNNLASFRSDDIVALANVNTRIPTTRDMMILNALRSTLSQSIMSRSVVSQGVNGIWSSVHFGAKLARQDRMRGVGLKDGLKDFPNWKNLTNICSAINKATCQTNSCDAHALSFTSDSNTQQTTPFGFLDNATSFSDARSQATQYAMYAMGVSKDDTTGSKLVEGIIDFACDNVIESSIDSSVAEVASIGSVAGKVSSVGSNVIGHVGAAFSAYELISNWGHNTVGGGVASGASVGAYIGSCFPVVGTAIGAIVGGVIGGVMGMVKTGKHADQVMRDQMRFFLRNTGIIDNVYCIQLADGSLFDMGKDGHFRLQNTDGTERAPYAVDVSHMGTSEIIGWAQPIAAILTGGDEKLRSDLTGYFVNAAVSNAADFGTACQNVRAIFAKTGLTQDSAMSALQQLVETGKLSQDDFSAYAHGLQTMIIGQTSSGVQVA